MEAKFFFFDRLPRPPGGHREGKRRTNFFDDARARKAFYGPRERSLVRIRLLFVLGSDYKRADKKETTMSTLLNAMRRK